MLVCCKKYYSVFLSKFHSWMHRHERPHSNVWLVSWFEAARSCSFLWGNSGLNRCRACPCVYSGPGRKIKLKIIYIYIYCSRVRARTCVSVSETEWMATIKICISSSSSSSRYHMNAHQKKKRRRNLNGSTNIVEKRQYLYIHLKSHWRDACHAARCVSIEQFSPWLAICTFILILKSYFSPSRIRRCCSCTQQKSIRRKDI